MRSRRCRHHYVDGVVLTPYVIDWTPTVAATGRGGGEAGPMMQLDPSIAVYLSDDELFMIEIAVEILDDEFLHEIATRLDNGIPDRGPTLTYLPHRYDGLYDAHLARRWYICFLVVAERLAHGWEPLRCRGEELALRAIIGCARTQLELNSLDRDDSFFPLENALSSKTSTTSCSGTTNSTASTTPKPQKATDSASHPCTHQPGSNRSTRHAPSTRSQNCTNKGWRIAEFAPFAPRWG